MHTYINICLHPYARTRARAHVPACAKLQWPTPTLARRLVQSQRTHTHPHARARAHTHTHTHRSHAPVPPPPPTRPSLSHSCALSLSPPALYSTTNTAHAVHPERGVQAVLFVALQRQSETPGPQTLAPPTTPGVPHPIGPSSSHLCPSARTCVWLLSGCCTCWLYRLRRAAGSKRTEPTED